MNNCYKYSALHYAAEKHNSEEIVRLLVEGGIDFDVCDVRGTTPLGTAAHGGNDITVAALLDCGADIDHLDDDGDSPLSESLFNNSDKITKLLLSRGATYTMWCSIGDSILHLAAKSGGNKLIEILLEACLHGVDPDALNREKKTTLQIAQERKGTEEGFIEKVQELLADIRARNATYESTVKEPADPPEESTMLQYIRTQLQASSFNPFQPRQIQDRNHPQYQKRIWTHWLLLGLCILGSTWIYKSLAPGTLSSLATLIWNMIGPGDLDDL